MVKTIGGVLDDIRGGKKYPNPDEPVFVLRGRDPLARIAILTWVHAAIEAGVSTSKIAQAIEAARACTTWPDKQLPD